MAKTSWIRALPEFELDQITQVKSMFGIREQTASLWLTFQSILDEYSMRLTVRQLYYQLVARGYIVNTAKSYNNTDVNLTNARKVGFIPWERFEDRARNVLGQSDFGSLDLDSSPEQEALLQVKEAFWVHGHFLPLWWNQPYNVEVWTEKDALAGLIEDACSRWNIKVVVSRGYTSYTYRREAEQRLNSNSTILYFGDLDPSGVDIPRMLDEELADVEVRRIALLPDQIEGLPPNPIKESDSRSPTFKKLYTELGNSCYELDALSPPQLQGLVDSAIREYFDGDIARERQQKQDQWQQSYKRELVALKGKIDWAALNEDGN